MTSDHQKSPVIILGDLFHFYTFNDHTSLDFDFFLIVPATQFDPGLLYR